MPTVSGWLARGRELGCFADDAEQMKYLISLRRGSVGTARSMLRSVLSGPYPLHLVNAAGFPELYRSLGRCEDGPSFLPEDWRESDFVVRLHGGESVTCSWVTGGGPEVRDAAVASALHCFARRVAVAGSLQDKIGLVRSGREEVLRVSSSVGQSLSSLFRALAVAEFFASAPTGSPQLASLVPDHERLASASDQLRQRASAVVGLWRSFIGARVTASPCPLTHAALEAASSVQEIEQALLLATGPGNANLVSYLGFRDP